MDISTDDKIIELCVLIDSSCEDSEGTNLLYKYWKKTRKLDLFLLYFKPEDTLRTTFYELKNIAKIEVLLEQLCDKLTDFLDLIKDKPSGDTVPSDKKFTIDALLKELKYINNYSCINIGSTYEELEKRVAIIISCLDDIAAACKYQSLILTNLESSEQILSCPINFSDMENIYFVRIK